MSRMQQAAARQHHEIPETDERDVAPVLKPVFKEVLIFSPSVKTGGLRALHQLGYRIARNGGTARMAYYDIPLSVEGKVMLRCGKGPFPMLESTSATQYQPQVLRESWALDLEDLSTAVVKRIPLRNDDKDRYFPNDRFQVLPRDGYRRVFEAILDHPQNCSRRMPRKVRVRSNHAGRIRALLHQQLAIDEYFDDRFGPLPYRSIRFHHRDAPLTYRGNRGSDPKLHG